MQNKVAALARPEIVAMKAFSSARSEAVKGDIWLDANENPWGDGLYNRYPEPQPDALVSKLAALYRIHEDNLLVTRGSDEGIDLLIRLFCRAEQDQVMIFPPTYGMYSVAATIQGAGIVEVPLIKSQGFSLDILTIFKVWQPSIKLLFLCSPNNPTGNSIPMTDILTLCKKMNNQSLIVVDEAYIEFSGNESIIEYLNDYPNLIVLRTLSKAYGLASIRCGITIAHPTIVQLLKKIIAPYPIAKPIVNIVSNQLCLNEMHRQIKKINDEKEKLFKFLSQMPWVKTVWKSDANFLLFEVVDAKKIINLCLNYGIVLRNRSADYQLNNCIRVTMGLESENKFLMEVLNRA